MLTGRYPSDLGITHMGVPVPEQTETLASVLAPRGSRTANIGKLHFLPHANRDHSSAHPPLRFDVLALSDEPGVYEDDYRASVRATAPQALDSLSLGLPRRALLANGDRNLRSDHTRGHRHSQRLRRRHVSRVRSRTHASARVATRTIEHLKALPAVAPAFTIASFFSPHSPYHVPPEFLDLYDRDQLPLPELTATDRARQDDLGLTDDRLRAIRHGYYAAISEVDHHIGRILQTLERLGRAENTVVVFLSDHGEWLGDHLRLAKGYPADDPVSRVPLIIRWPAGVTAPGRTVSTIVEAIDVMPTLLDALGVPIPRTVQGRSLLPALRGDQLRREELGITEHAGWRSVRTRSYRYLIHADGRESLWHLDNDPHEDTDVAANPAHATTLADHRLLLLQRLLDSERPLPRTWPY